MNAEDDKPQLNGRETSRQISQEDSDLIDGFVSTMLKFENCLKIGAAENAADQASIAIHKAPFCYSDIQRGRVLAGITKLAFGTYEETIALYNAHRVSSLSHALGAVVYSLSAMHGPQDNLFLVYASLFETDRQITAAVIGRIAKRDPSDYVRELALQWIAHSLPSEAAKLVDELIRCGTYTGKMTVRYCRALLSNPVEPPGARSVLSADEVRTALRILSAIEQITLDPNLEYRVSAVGILSKERPLYAIPMLTLAAQVSEPQVRNSALVALARLDPETASIVRDTAPSFLSRLDFVR